MVFSSLEFLFFYLPVTVAVYYVAPLKWRNFWLLLISLAFYGWGEPYYVFLMMFSIMIDYVCGYFVSKYREDRKKARRFVIISMVLNLTILGIFKYTDFIIGNLRLIPALSHLKPLGLKLPIGISFYTFQTMSYTIDIYRGEANMQRNITSFGAYVTLFPQLIAGPIVRYKDIDEQLTKRKHSLQMFAGGVRTFTAGLAKKVLLANTAGGMWDYIQGLPPEQTSALTAWLGVFFFMFQIYFDFSGYSDMAIGLGKMFGFTFLENFDHPYTSRSVTEFWRRWHISLGTWFREYVYIPLGGNRKGLLATYRNLAVVWLLTGFWHGASWNYVLWGVFFGAILMMEKGFLLKALEKTPSFVRRFYTLLLVYFSWWLFTFDDLGAGIVHLRCMFGGGGQALANRFADYGAVYDLIHTLPLIAVLVIGSTSLPKSLWHKYRDTPAVRVLTPAAVMLALFVCTAYLVDSSFNPFLYLRF